MKKVGVWIIGIFLILSFIGFVIGEDSSTDVSDSSFPVLTGSIGGGDGRFVGADSQDGCDCGIVEVTYCGIDCGSSCSSGGESVELAENCPGAVNVGLDKKQECKDAENKKEPSCGCYNDVNPTTGTISGSGCKAVELVNKNCEDINGDGDSDSFVNHKGEEQCCFVNLDFMKKTTSDGCPDAPPLRDISDLVPSRDGGILKGMIKQVKVASCYYANLCRGFDSVREHILKENDKSSLMKKGEITEDEDTEDGVVEEDDNVDEGIDDEGVGGEGDNVDDEGEEGNDREDDDGYRGDGDLSNLNFWESIKKFFKGIFGF